MHPEISLFPNSYFYRNKIRDAPNLERNYGKQYLPGAMFGPYSFINVAGGREEFDDNGISYKNMAEVAVVMTILKNLHKGLSIYAISRVILMFLILLKFHFHR
jgi:senataxin